MTKEEKHIKLIDGYLRNSLTGAELKEFEELLIKDDDFGQMFIEMKTLVDGIRSAASKTTLEEKLRRFEEPDIYDISPEQEEHGERERKGMILIVFNYLAGQKWAVAAVLALFVIVTAVLVNINTKPSGDKLFEEYFLPFGTGGTYGLMRGDSAKNDLSDEAFYYYDREEFILAHDLFEQVLDEDSRNVLALFYSGNALMAIGQVNEAIDRFKEVIQLGEGLEIQSKWYLALCYLKLENYRKAIPLLKEIIKSNTRYSEKAEWLLRKIS